MNKKPVNQHKQMAMGNMSIGFKKGGKVDCYAEGGSGVKREDMSGKRVKGKDGEVSTYKKGGSTGKGKKK